MIGMVTKGSVDLKVLPIVEQLVVCQEPISNNSISVVMEDLTLLTSLSNSLVIKIWTEENISISPHLVSVKNLRRKEIQNIKVNFKLSLVAALMTFSVDLPTMESNFKHFNQVKWVEELEELQRVWALQHKLGIKLFIYFVEMEKKYLWLKLPSQDLMEPKIFLKRSTMAIWSQNKNMSSFHRSPYHLENIDPWLTITTLLLLIR